MFFSLAGSVGLDACHLHSQYRLKFRTTNSHWTPGCGDLHVLTARWRSSHGRWQDGRDSTSLGWFAVERQRGTKSVRISSDARRSGICIFASRLARFETRVAALCSSRGTLQRCQDLLVRASFKEGFALLALPPQPIHMQGTYAFSYNNAFTTTDSSRLELCPLERITL